MTSVFVNSQHAQCGGAQETRLSPLAERMTINGGPPVGTRPAWEQKNLESDLELIQKTRISEFQQLQKNKKGKIISILIGSIETEWGFLIGDRMRDPR